MKEKINSYFAILLITIAGAGASLLIVRMAFDIEPRILASYHGLL